MSQSVQEYVINNGRRYQVTIHNYLKEKDYILYEAQIFDTAFGPTYLLYFRFKTLRKLHDQMTKKATPNELPDFPKTKSLGFWNRTNSDPKLIQERIRDLQYYLTKLLNNGRLQQLQEVQNNRSRRPLSCYIQPEIQNKIDRPQLKECPQFYRKEMTVMNLL